jgi:molybdenum cofactor synthesis domain-containing protein
MRQSPYPMVSVNDALASILRHVAPLPAGPAPLRDALGLVLAEDLHAPADQPPFPAAIVDGFALRAADGAAPRRLAGEQMAGVVAGIAVAPGEAVRITTGAPIPPGADAVVMVEQADERNGVVTLHPGQDLRPGLGIRPVGIDVQAGQRVLAAGQPLGPAELGMVASLGLPTASVHRRPRVGVFSTGDELAQPGQTLRPGQIYDSNRPTLLAAVAQAGGQPIDLGIVRDRPGELEQALAAGLAAADLLVTSGGVSMGELDLLKPLLAGWGQVHFGRVRMKPGKPLTFATLPARQTDGALDPDQPARPIFALPGNPVSALVTFQLFVRPAIRRMAGYAAVGLPQVIATLGQTFPLDPERPEFHRVTLRRAAGRFVAVSTGSQASSRLLSASGADGLLVLEQGAGTAPAGAERPVLLLTDAWLSMEWSFDERFTPIDPPG